MAQEFYKHGRGGGTTDSDIVIDKKRLIKSDS